jgi:hypothetical protein
VLDGKLEFCSELRMELSKFSLIFSEFLGGISDHFQEKIFIKY